MCHAIFQTHWISYNISEEEGMCGMHELNLVSPHPSNNLAKHLKLPFCEFSDMAKPPSE